MKCLIFIMFFGSLASAGPYDYKLNVKPAVPNINLKIDVSRVGCAFLTAFPRVLEFERTGNLISVPMRELSAFNNHDLFRQFDSYSGFFKPLIETLPDLVLAHWANLPEEGSLDV